MKTTLANQETTEITKLREENAELRLEVKDLLAKLRFLSGQRYATSQSEKMAPLQGSLFNEAELTVETAEPEDEELEVGSHKRKKSKRKPLSDHLPRQVFHCDLAEGDKRCDDGHGTMLPAGVFVKEQLEYEPARFRVLRHECSSYVCPVCCSKKTAPLARPEPLAGTMATPSLLAHVATSKYQDHLPLYRQEAMLARDGIFISRTTLATWMIKISSRLDALINLLDEEITSYDIVQVDETRLQVLSIPGKSAKSPSFVWVLVGGRQERPVVLFEFDPSRAGSVAERILADFSGYMQADGYGGYNAVARRNDIERVACLMHIRRPFREAYEQLKDVGGGDVAKRALAHIQAIYKVEEEAKADPKAGRLAMSSAQRHALRQEKTTSLLAMLKSHLEEHAPLVRPSSPTGKAIEYALREWTNLVRFMEDGRLEVDNGRAERAIRPFAQGRRNWLFADSEAGAKASANLFSLIETAKLNSLEPRRYLQFIFERIDRATTLADLEALLPWNAASQFSS